MKQEIRQEIFYTHPEKKVETTKRSIARLVQVGMMSEAEAERILNGWLKKEDHKVAQ